MVWYQHGMAEGSTVKVLNKVFGKVVYDAPSTLKGENEESAFECNV